MAKKITCAYILLAITTLLLLAKMLYERWFSNFTLDLVLSPIDVIGFVITIGVTIFAAWFISKKITSQRYFVEYVIQDLKAIHCELEELQCKIDERNEFELSTSAHHYSKIIYLFKRYNSTIDIIDIKGFSQKRHPQIIDDLYDQLTDVEGSVLLLDGNKKIEIDAKISKAIIEVRTLIFKINNV